MVSEERSDFLQIFLDVKHGDLYTAWEAACHTEVDYTTPGGAQATGSTRIWIRRLPKLLFFQLQRVAFDQEKKAQVKLDDAFEFDTTVFVDRFLHEHREAASEANARVGELQARREQLARALATFEEYQGRPGLSVEDVLAWAADCLEDNSRAASAAPPLPLAALASADELRHPHRLAAAADGASWFPQGIAREAPAAAQLLRGVRDSCRAQAAGLRGRLEELAAEASGAYRELEDSPYELYAIWVHQGIAGSGHYLAYLRDWRHDRWIRFDDASVSVVPWADVRAAAVGQEGSNTSAYVLVYMERGLAAAQGRAESEKPSAGPEAALPPDLLEDIRRDNEELKVELGRREERMADQLLRRHAEAIFQHYAGLLHQWEPLKRLGDAAGSPHDQKARKYLNDPALLRFELFIYRRFGEQEVWTFLLAQSIEAQRAERTWVEEDEGRVLFYLGHAIRNQRCYSSMLRERSGEKHAVEAELLPLDMAKLTGQYNVALIQAHIVDEALQTLRSDRLLLVEAVSMLALIWARWNLEAEDKFRQNEVLLVMSALIFNVINSLERERHRRGSADIWLAGFRPACEYFLLLLYAVEWPKNWKTPLIQRIQCLFPTLGSSPGYGATRVLSLTDFQHLSVAEQKEAILQHPLTQDQARWESFEERRPEPGHDFFERHRVLYGWVMQSDEEIANDYVISKAALSLGEVGLPGASV